MDAFRQHRTWKRARRLGLSQLACLGRHTVAGLIGAGGRQADDWSADCRLFARDKWNADDLFVPVVRGVLHMLQDNVPLVTALLVVAGDGSYTNKTVLRTLPDRTTFIGRIRQDAKLHHPPRADQQPKVGRKRRYGDVAHTPDELRKDESVPWQSVEAYASGKIHAFRIKEMKPIRWRKAGADLPVRIVVIAPVGYRLRNGGKLRLPSAGGAADLRDQ